MKIRRIECNWHEGLALVWEVGSIFCIGIEYNEGKSCTVLFENETETWRITELNVSKMEYYRVKKQLK